VAAAADCHYSVAMSPRLLVAALLLTPAPALAVDQGSWQVGGGADFALLVEGDDPTSGLGGRLDLRYGLTDAAALWAAAASSWHPRATAQARSSSASLGVALAFDVLQIVPFAEAGVTLADLDNGPLRAGYLGLEAAGGVEYLFDRRWSAAATARYQYLPLKLGGAAAADKGPGLLTVGLSLRRSF
jgi:hypothetical protein